jgi:hypothetical protein
MINQDKGLAGVEELAGEEVSVLISFQPRSSKFGRNSC